MVGKPCKVAGCERLNDSLGYCRLHYQRLRNGVDLDKPIRKKASKRGGCSVDGCARPHKAKGYCDFHYKKHRMLAERCSVDGCERPQHAKDYCQRHYRRQLEGRDMSTPIRPTKRSDAENKQLMELAGTVIGAKVCVIPGCERKHEAFGFCHKHYLAWRRAGGEPRRPKKRRICSVEGCGAPHEAHGYCSKHYAQWRRNVLDRDPLVLEAKERRRKIELYKWQLKIHKMFA